MSSSGRGATLIYQMIEEYSLKTVQEYMLHVRTVIFHLAF